MSFDFGQRKGPSKQFVHAEGCKVLRADRSVEIPWSETRKGHWEAVCQCGREYYDEPGTARVRLDPLDPKTSRHLGQCEYSHETDPAVVRVLLKITPKGGYAWVECGGCGSGWQVADYAKEKVG